MRIQDCIGDPRVVSGDTCLVSPGNYVENVNFNEKNIAVADYIAQRAWLRGVVRTLLLPVVGFVSLFAQFNLDF